MPLAGYDEFSCQVANGIVKEPGIICRHCIYFKYGYYPLNAMWNVGSQGYWARGKASALFQIYNISDTSN